MIDPVHPSSTPADPGLRDLRPGIVAVMGLPGAGKSTVAIAIERQLGMRRVCRDAIRAAMFPDCHFSFIEKRAAFRGVLLTLEINCALGASSVIDGMTFSRRDDYDRVADLGRERGIAIVPLLLDCTPSLARSRIANDLARKGHRAGDRVPAIVEAVAARFESPPAESIRIDANLPAAELCSRAVAIVASRLGIDAGSA
jgi:predicted kinase